MDRSVSSPMELHQLDNTNDNMIDNQASFKLKKTQIKDSSEHFEGGSKENSDKSREKQGGNQRLSLNYFVDQTNPHRNLDSRPLSA